MSKRAALLLAPDFEEAEAFITLDILSRLGIQVTTVACHAQNQVISYHGVVTVADVLLEALSTTWFDAIVIPGGPEGTVNLAASLAVSAFIQRHDEANKIIAPICSAAARVLAGNQLLKGRRYTCSGELWMQHSDGEYVMKDVVEDGNLISGRGLGVAFDFAFQLALKLTGKAGAADFQAEHIYYDRWRSQGLK